MKLPVLAIFSETYSFVFRSYRLFLTLAAPAIIVTAIPIALTGGWLWNVLGQPGDEIAYAESFMTLINEGRIFTPEGALLVVLYAITLVLSVVVFFMYSVAWHRSYLLPAQPVSAAAAYRLHRRHLLFFYNYLKLILLAVLLVLLFGLAMVPIGFVAGAGAQSGAAGQGVSVVLVVTAQTVFFVGMLWVYARFSLLFPATAVDKHMKLAEVLQLTRGHGWRLTAVIVLTAIPVILVSALLSLIIGTLSSSVGIFGSLTVLLLSGLANQFVSYIGIAFGITALSIAYDKLQAGNVAATFA